MADLITWELKTIPLKELKSHPKNPRQIKQKTLIKLTELIEKFGLIDKPIINLDHTIIGGHQRVTILRKQRAKNVDCWVPNRLLSEKEVDELMIGVNKFHGEWDIDCLANEWEPLDLLNYGFSEDELIGTCKEAEEILEKEQKNKEKKQKECPNCGHLL